MRLKTDVACPLPLALRRMMQECVDHPAVSIPLLADALCLSPETVHTYFKRVNQLLGTHKRTDAIIIGLQQGWPPLHPPPAKMKMKMKIDAQRKHLQNVPKRGLAR